MKSKENLQNINEENYENKKKIIIDYVYRLGPQLLDQNKFKSQMELNLNFDEWIIPVFIFVSFSCCEQRKKKNKEKLQMTSICLYKPLCIADDSHFSFKNKNQKLNLWF